VNTIFRFRRIGVILFVLFIFFSWGNTQEFSKYHSYNEMTDILRKLADNYSHIARLESIGKSLEGRYIWLMEIANPAGVPVEERPALFIGANFEGDHLIGSEIALCVANYLLQNYNTDSAVREKIDKYVFYIVPRVNPDAAEMMFANLKTGRKTNTNPYDGDNDGRIDEDGPEDLNNDGYITVMRVKKDGGAYMIDPGDQRLMKKADPVKGESGTHTLYREGIDNDKDGFINEDPPGGIDINRNFQHEYPYYKPDAGWHMVSELESRALMDWIIDHRNVAIILTFGESDNLIIPPNDRGQLSPPKEIELFTFADESNSDAGKVGIFKPVISDRYAYYMRMMRQQQQPTQPRRRRGRQVATTVDTADIAYFKTISKKYGELTGITTQPPVRKPEGAFFQYGYYQFGVPSFSTPGWGITAPESGESRRGGRQSPMSGRTGRTQEPVGIDSLVLNWMDRENIDGFAGWTSYTHPDLGEVEIGGFKPGAVINPPASKISVLGDSHAKFVTYLSSLFPKISIAKTEVINHGGGIFQIKAEIGNTGFLPTSLNHGVISRSVKPTMVQLEVDPEAIISGNKKTSFFHALAGSGNRKKFEWVIKGERGDRLELKVVSQKAGSDKKIIVLE